MLSYENQEKHFTPIGAFISHLIRRIAWENSGLRDLADYYRLAKLDGAEKVVGATGLAPFIVMRFVLA